MTDNTEKQQPDIQDYMPDAEIVRRALGKAKSIDDFFGKEGIFARLFAGTLEQMLQAELSEHLGYGPYEAKGRNSGNSRNGTYKRKVRTSEGQTDVQVPRDRKGTFEPHILPKGAAATTNELENKIIGMYAKGMSVRDIQEQLGELYGVEVSPATVSAITDKVWGLVEAWQSRPLASTYAIVYLDAIHIKLRKRKPGRKHRRVHRARSGHGRASGCFGALDRRWWGRGKFLAIGNHRFAEPGRKRHLDCLHGWVDWLQRSHFGRLS